MQPYLFPYLGYFQLIHSVDVLVHYDDVNFIKRGWINRNRLIVNGLVNYIRIPLRSASQNSLIQDVLIDESSNWRVNELRKVEYSYRKAQFFEPVYALVEDVFNLDSERIVDFAIGSIQKVTNYIGIVREFQVSSHMFNAPRGLDRQDRIIQICKLSNAKTYVNMPGGKQLYEGTDFCDHGVELRFIKPSLPEYDQFSESFEPGLSIIDVLMHVGPERTKEMIEKYTFY